MKRVDYRDEPDTEALLRRVIDLISATRALPLSSSVKLDNKEEVLQLLDEACRRLPDEMRQARWMVKERNEFVAKTERDCEDILDAARLRAARMVQRAQIVRDAKTVARKTLEEAEENARRLRLEAEDYCDQKLAAFEIVLERTAKTVHAGRQRLAALPPVTVPPPEGELASADPSDETLAAADAFFDQDRLP